MNEPFRRLRVQVKVHHKDFEMLQRFTDEEKGDLLSDGLHQMMQQRYSPKRWRWQWPLVHR